MSKDFLNNLSGALESQFNLGENKNNSLNVIGDGTFQYKKYGKLGEFAKKINSSQSRQYVEEGYLRFDPFNVNPKNLEILLQEPDITLLVKKRAFSTLSENFRLDHLDKDEKLFYKATKILFQNKASQISALEKLSKIERISIETGELSKELTPLIFSLIDQIGNTVNGSLTTSTTQDVLNGTFTSGFGKIQSVVNQIRKFYNYSTNSQYTSWLQDTTSPFKTKLGQGSGVIEFTNVNTLSTNCTLETNPASANFNIVDPYNMMLITSSDIERAITDATNIIYSHKIFQFGQESSDDLASATLKRLNDIRKSRRASNIKISVNPDTVYGKKVIAVIEDPGIEINFTYNSIVSLFSLGLASDKDRMNISPECLYGSDEVGAQGLTENEIALFSRVLDNIYNSLTLKSTSKSINYQKNEETNYARRQLRFHYLGKSVIQNMDQLHIYISSKSKLDGKISGNLQSKFNTLGFVQNLNNSAGGFRDQWESLFNPAKNINFQIEKEAIVGKDFPNWLWPILRNQFISDSAGTHVYGGIITSATRNCEAGFYSVNIQASSNLEYLNFGKVNFKPSLNVFNGPLYDPLTPFKTNFDTITGTFKKDTPILLDENKELINYNLIKFKSGPLAGQLVTETNLLQTGDQEVDEFGAKRNIYYCPDGFAYRWKQGIGTLVQFSESYASSSSNSAGIPPVTTDPFAGQDIMNVISLSITGIPYNYNTFMKAAKQANGYSRDIHSGEDGAYSFYGSLLNNLKKNNILWGNFIPFKNLVVDESLFQRALQAQASINNYNDQINQKLKEANDLSNKIILASSINTPNAPIVENSNYLKSIDQLKQTLGQLSGLNSQVQNQLKSVPGQSLTVVGNDISYDSDQFISQESVKNEGFTNPKVRRSLRKKLNFLTRRLAYQVRGNDDKNYFIVDDSYDKDYDLIAYEYDLSGQMRAFDSEYLSVLDKVSAVKSLLDLEVFCDTQGHIRVRPPQYNKMPSSVFYRMMRLKQDHGIQLFPKFLEDLFLNQIDSLIKNIAIIENEIRLDAAVLGYNTDNSILNLITGQAIPEKNFEFISDESSRFEVTRYNKIIDNGNLLKNESDSFTKYLKNQSSLNNVFNNQARSSAFVSNIYKNQDHPVPITIPTSDRINNLKEVLFKQTGQQVSLDNFLQTDSTNNTALKTSINQKVDLFKVINDLSEKFSRRQRLIKLAYNALKNAKEYALLDDPSIVNKVIAPNLYKNENVPEFIESMLEDETYDDYGPNSGSRYIIKDYQILNFNISESNPEFTAVQITGQFDPFVPNSNLNTNLDATFVAGGGQGNPFLTAAAIDYDLWKTYGLITTKSLSIPFLSKPQTQCAPYAAMLLSRARKNILRGGLTIVGNEYMQPGDVIYLESQDLLFYVTSVGHSFNYNGRFSTALTLTYGHPPGEYIPTVLDFIGKLIYNNRDSTYFVNYRQDSTLREETNLGVITLDPRSNSNDILNDLLLGGTFGTQNANVINNLINSVNEVFGQNDNVGNNSKAILELRVYKKSEDSPVNKNVSEASSILLNLLTGNQTLPQQFGINVSFQEGMKKSAQYIKEIEVDSYSDRSPSKKAIDMARNLQDIKGSTSLKDALCDYIIDCWVVFTEKS